MRTVAGILVALGMMLTACDAVSEMDPALQDPATVPAQHERTQESALAHGDCTASIYCGNWTTCSGTAGQCSVNPAGFGSVTCNGVTTNCNPIITPRCGCSQDGCCSELCALDPDCGPNACVSGKSCTSDSQCGGTLNGRCSSSTRKCVCL